MKVESIFLIGKHQYAFRSGEPAEVIGMVMVTPNGKEKRAAFHIRYSDGVCDYVPVTDYIHGNYEFMDAEDVFLKK